MKILSCSSACQTKINEEGGIDQSYMTAAKMEVLTASSHGAVSGYVLVLATTCYNCQLDIIGKWRTVLAAGMANRLDKCELHIGLVGLAKW